MAPKHPRDHSLNPFVPQSPVKLAGNDRRIFSSSAGLSEKDWAVLPNSAFDPGPVTHDVPTGAPVHGAQ